MSYHYTITLPVNDVAQLRVDKDHGYEYATRILHTLDDNKVTVYEGDEYVDYVIPEHLAWDLHETVDMCLNSEALVDLSEQGIDNLISFWNSVV